MGGLVSALEQRPCRPPLRSDKPLSQRRAKSPPPTIFVQGCSQVVEKRRKFGFSDHIEFARKRSPETVAVAIVAEQSCIGWEAGPGKSLPSGRARQEEIEIAVGQRGRQGDLDLGKAHVVGETKADNAVAIVACRKLSLLRRGQVVDGVAIKQRNAPCARRKALMKRSLARIERSNDRCVAPMAQLGEFLSKVTVERETDIIDLDAQHLRKVSGKP